MCFERIFQICKKGTMFVPPVDEKVTQISVCVFTCVLVQHAKTLGVLQCFDTPRRSRHAKHDVSEKRTLETK